MFDYRLSESAKRTADILAVAVAVCLPWSTSATLICVALWLVATLPTLTMAELRRAFAEPAALLPLLLIALAIVGMAWADTNMAERWSGLRGFAKLPAIVLLLIQFQRSERGWWVLQGYLYSCVAILAASILIVLGVELPAMRTLDYGVPVKSASNQSFEFVLCAMVSVYLAYIAIEARRWLKGAAFALLAALFFWNVFFVAASRTALLAVPVLLLVFAYKKISWRGKIVAAFAGIALCAVAWFGSNYVRMRLLDVWHETNAYSERRELTSSGERLEFWRKSWVMVQQAPVIGNGTGMIVPLFRKAVANESGVYATASTNPHQQTLAVAIQLGIVGAFLLWAMWLTHLFLFRGESLAAWVGLCVVVQNLLGSLFNSHLFDFNQGWIYAVGVGVAGALVLRERHASLPPRS